MASVDTQPSIETLRAALDSLERPDIRQAANEATSLLAAAETAVAADLADRAPDLQALEDLRGELERTRRELGEARQEAETAAMQAQMLSAALARRSLSEQRLRRLEQAERELQHQTLHDQLTGLPNRRFLRWKIAAALNEHPETRFGVCFIDLDDFKIVNDTLGHDTGDRLLVDVSARIQQRVGDSRFVARLGGDEFALVIEEPDPKSRQTEACIRQIAEALREPFTVGAEEIYVGASIGATYCPDDSTDIDTLLRHADVAMYQAKAEGKNKLCRFSSELAERLEDRQSMHGELRRAIQAGNELSIAYQGKVRLDDLQPCGCEALLRWTLPDGSSVSPLRFITVAEQTGLITQLGDFVLDGVCQQAREWHDRGLLVGPVAINVSPRQLRDGHFPKRLRQALDAHRADPAWLEVEITENAVMEDLEAAMKLMNEIRDLGVSIAIDDFGTGYSSLNYLKNFNINTLKIDVTFVADLPDCPRAAAIVQTILSLGHGLELQVVAEGVETREQLDFLKASNCDVAQGYHLCRSLPAGDLERWIESWPALAAV